MLLAAVASQTKGSLGDDWSLYSLAHVAARRYDKQVVSWGSV